MSLAPLRTAWRLARTGLHLAYGMGVAACVYPFVPQAARLALKQRWSRQLLAMLGLRLHAGGVARPGGLLVANHISWLDIFVINAVRPAAFVCKAEVRDWPLIGWLCARTDTVFLERGSRSAAHNTGKAIADKLARGELVAVFPEGTTSDGKTLLRFRAALLQAAIDAGSAVQPLALRYVDAAGGYADAPAYCGDTSLWESLLAIAAAPALTARVETLPAIAAANTSRGELAAVAHALIAATLAHPTPRGGEEPSCRSAFRPTAAAESA